ncbi:MAG TPA: hypothetical protein VN493_26015 [Thermoanaerobaculia bacterium]|nr:hypothetical protein [Thermoanaerobaculia bacterium]
MTRRSSRLPRRAFLLGWCGLALASGAVAEDSGARRLVLVTFERRAPALFAADSPAYGRFLAERRDEVLSLLFAGEEPRIHAGDMVALFSDGAPAGFPGALQLPARATDAEVMAALAPMLQAPGPAPSSAAGVLWLGRSEGAPFAAATDEALRRHVTCPLTGLAGLCADEKQPQKPLGTAEYSRPLLTLPLQLDLALRSVEARDWPAPTEVLWVWVQVGHRVNEINSLAAELVRDFGPDRALILERFRRGVLANLDIDLLETGVDQPVEGGGVTLWRLTASRLDPFAASDQREPLVLQRRDGEAWRDLPSDPTMVTTVRQALDRLLEPGPFRVSLQPEAVAMRARLVAVTGYAVCRQGGVPSRREALELSLRPQGELALLSGDSERRLEELQAACLPPQGIWDRLRRELGDGIDRAEIEIGIQAKLAPPASSFRPPLIQVATSAVRSWRHEPLRAVDLLAYSLFLGLTLSTSIGGWQLLSYCRRPTELDLVLVDASGHALTPDTPLAFDPGDAAALPELRAILVRRQGRPRSGSFALELEARGLQSEIPLAAGASSTDLVVLRTTGNPARRSNSLALPLSLQGIPGRDGLGLPSEPLQLFVPPEVLDVDRLPVGEPRRAGIEISAAVQTRHPGFLPLQRRFYIPCVITVRRASARPPALRLVIRQGFLFRGLRPLFEREPIRLGGLVVHHRAEPASGARPWPVRLNLQVSASLVARGGAQVKLPITFADGRVGAVLSRVIDRPEEDLQLSLEPLAPAVVAAGPGTVKIETLGTWQEIQDGVEGPPQPLAACQESLAFYPIDTTLHGIAVDFGTSATRLASLTEGEMPEATQFIAVPADLVEKPELTGELVSEVAIDAQGRVIAAGSEAFRIAAQKQAALLPSLKEELLARSGDRGWQAAEQVIALLAGCIEGPRQDPSRSLARGRFIGDGWRFTQKSVSPGLRYLLLVTIPDTFGSAEQERFLGYFRGWQGSVGVLPLREAEAVVFGALIAGDGSRPRTTLVVDVGAGTVDYAVVRSDFTAVGDLEKMQILGLSVSRQAGNAYDRALQEFLKIPGDSPEIRRNVREVKEKAYGDPEASGEKETTDMERFLNSQELHEHLDRAIDDPLEALLGRLCLLPDRQPLRFDQVVLSGRGSLALGWKTRLVVKLREFGLVEGEERIWLRWLSKGKVTRAERADRLKGAVARGALALISAHQARIVTSREILRDHVVLVAQTRTSHYEAWRLLSAGEALPGEGLEAQIALGDWISALLVFSSHPPIETSGASPDRARPAADLWRAATLPSYSEDGVPSGLQVVVVREIDPTRASPHLEIRVFPGGRLEATF